MGNSAAPSFVFLSSFFSLLLPLVSLAFGAAASHRRRLTLTACEHGPGLCLVLRGPWGTGSGNGSHSLPSTKFEVHCAVILTIMLMSIGYRDASIEHRASTTRAMIHQNSRHGNAICVIYADCLAAWLPGCPVSSAHTVICSIMRAIRQIQNADYQMWRLNHRLRWRHLSSSSAWLILIYDFNSSTYKLKAFRVRVLVRVSDWVLFDFHLFLTCSKCCHRRRLDT